VDAKATNRPSEVIDDSPLVPSAGVTPSNEEISWVAPTQPEEVSLTQVLRRNTSDDPSGFGAEVPRLEAEDVNDTNSPSFATDGFALAAFAGVVPSAVEASTVVAVHPVVAPLHVSLT
jgi:hypothetical protein